MKTLDGRTDDGGIVILMFAIQLVHTYSYGHLVSIADADISLYPKPCALLGNSIHKYTERQKSCTTFSFDFFWNKIDDFKNQCSLVFMPVQLTIVVEKNKACMKSCLHFYEKNIKS